MKHPPAANSSFPQLDITDDGYLNLMSDDGSLKDDVKMPDGEMGDKITKIFRTEEKETSTFHRCVSPCSLPGLTLSCQTSSSSRPWARRLLLKPRRPPARTRRIPTACDKASALSASEATTVGRYRMSADRVLRDVARTAGGPCWGRFSQDVGVDA